MKSRNLKSFFLITTALLISISFVLGKEKPNFFLNGTIVGKKIKSITIQYIIEKKIVKDSAIIKNGRFYFEGFIKEPVLAHINYSIKPIWIEAHSMTITLNTKELIYSQFTGSKTQQDQDTYNLLTEKVSQELENIYKEYLLIYDKQKSNRDNVQHAELITQATIKLSKADSIYRTKHLPIDIKFMRTHKNSYFSVFLLGKQIANGYINSDKGLELFNLLGDNYKNTPSARDIKILIDKMANNKIAAIAPDFEAWEDIRNSYIRLSDFRNKVVLLDFWATYYYPSPYIWPLYMANHNKGFEIITVNTNLNVNQRGINWTSQKIRESDWHHIKMASDMGLQHITAKDIYSNYITKTPRKVLIDKKGVIRGVWTNAEENEGQEITELVNKLLAE